MTRIDGTGATLWRRLHAGLLWAFLLPLIFLLRPYSGIIQDARIYIGRGLADRDPTGLGRDIMFSNDGQTGFSLFRPIVRSLLSVLPATETSTLLVAVGTVVWLLGAAALMCRIASGRVAWAAMVAVLALSADYGGYGVFRFAEAVATPRIFAEAAVLGGLAMLLDGRRLLACALLAVALALHPLMALPGLALAGTWLAIRNPRWLYVFTAGAALLLVAAWLQAPLIGRLFVLMDPTWLNLVRHRTFNLFPSLWPVQDDARILCHAAAALVAGSLVAPPARALLWGGVGIAACGLGLALAFGDAVPSVLVIQLQPWRALWLLTLLGNAGLALAAVRLWRAEAGGRVTLALLIMAWSAQSSPVLASGLALAAVALAFLDRTRRLGPISTTLARYAFGAALAAAVAETVGQAVALVRILLPLGGSAWHIGPWPYVVISGVLVLPIVAAAVAFALAAPGIDGPGLHRWPSQLAGVAGLLCSSLAAVLLWDSRTDENLLITTRADASELNRFFDAVPGDILWIDEASETWFMLGRPAFVNAQQGAPILFSRDLALEWADRAGLVVRLGLVRSTAVTPWAPEAQTDREVSLQREPIAEFCADRRHPAGLVAPGSQLDAVPPGLPARLWTPPVPFQSVSNGTEGLHWRPVPVFTLIQCAPLAAGPHQATPKVGDD